MDAAQCDNFEFLDDALMLRLNGPKTLAEFAEGTEADPNVTLTPFSRECASLWREFFGSRCGHYNAQATAAAKLKRNAQPGAFRATTLGVFAAARLAVASSRRRAAGQARGSSSVVVHPGAGTAGSALWTDSMQQFHERSRKNITGVTQTRARPGGPFLNPVGVCLNARTAAPAQPLACNISYAPKVAIVDMNKTKACPAKPPSKIILGPHRCAEVELAVVPDLTMLHDVDLLSSDIDLAVSFLYIVSLGVLTTTTAQLAAVHGIPRQLKPQGCVHHVPAASSANVTFIVTRYLREAHVNIYKALKNIASKPESTISVEKESTSAPGEIELNSLRDVVKWASSARMVRNVRGPKAFVPDGVAMPT